MEPPVSILAENIQPEILSLKISGRLDAASTGGAWRKTAEILGRSTPTKLVVDASEIDYCDCAGIGLFLEFHRRQKARGGALEIRHLRSEFHHLLTMFDPADFELTINPEPARVPFPEKLGERLKPLRRSLYHRIVRVNERAVQVKKDGFYLSRRYPRTHRVRTLLSAFSPVHFGLY